MKVLISPIIHAFKKLTVLDWIVGLILLSIFGFFLLNRYSKQEQWITIRLKVSNDEWWWSASAPQAWYGSGISKGQSAYNSFGKKIAEIQSVENYDQGGAARLIFTNLKVLTTVNKKTGIYTFNYQPLEIGKPLDFTFGKYNIHGLVVDVGENGIQYVTSKIELKLIGIYPWEAAEVKEGLKMRDSNGDLVAIVDKVDVKDATIFELRDVNDRPLIFNVENGMRKDVTLQVTLKTYIQNYIHYFIDGSAIRIGNRIWIPFETFELKDGVISAIY